MDWLTDPQVWAGLLTLTALEIVLGIDNLLFLSVLVGRVQARHQALARRLGLGLALGARLVLLASISWIVHLTHPLVTIGDHAYSWRDAILIGGGLFLVYKGTAEIHARVEGEHAEAGHTGPQASLAGIVVQIALLDIVFSLDSVITAVGMVNELPVMVAAVSIAMAVMLLAAAPVAAFVERHPTVKMLVFSFLLMIGMTLMADGFGLHLPKGYVYAAIGFSAGVEALNQLASRRARRRQRLAREGAREGAR
ncbi:MAG TPA: TerC family protein [Rhodopila sp.]|uniref:TerC family protein n=1 Tax=Rhodopila sp. TaxID=2480087 RepID=UPI002C66F369|nr:TerC family protein [Rhodopila sp.]HVY14368.1 TerC family protein [Rhodopila sp.]